MSFKSKVRKVESLSSRKFVKFGVESLKWEVRSRKSEDRSRKY